MENIKFVTKEEHEEAHPGMKRATAMESCKMSQAQMYEIVSTITARAIEKAEEVYGQELEKQRAAEDTRGQMSVMEEYAKTLATLAAAISAVALMRPMGTAGFGIGTAGCTKGGM